MPPAAACLMQLLLWVKYVVKMLMTLTCISANLLCLGAVVSLHVMCRRYDEAVIAAAHGNAALALQQFQQAVVVAQQQQDRQLETMAVTAVGLLQTSPGQSIEQQEEGWKVLQR